ncbi:MAG: DUF2332 domain-containing protein [Terricaulis sp.]
MSREKILAHFAEQSALCAEYGSPFTAQLIARMGEDLSAGGPVADLIGDWPSNPRADALSLRLAGALHAAVLTGRDFALAELYPAASPSWRMDDVWPAAHAFIAREQNWVREFIRSPPQTNETRRAIGLLAGFLSFARQWSGPVDMLEIGASAGLNLYWDRFAYRTKTWSWGQASPVQIDTDWHGPAPPVDVALKVRQRAACDLNPLDIADVAQVLQLKSYIWPDQADRLARFDGAAALAVEQGVSVERADAAPWLARKLKARADDAATIVYHSVFLQYPPREAREAIIAAIREEGERARPQAPLVWVRLEPEAVTDGVANGLRFVIDITTWPGGERRILGYTDGHVRAVYAV